VGVVTRKDSPWFWLTLERPGRPPIREATRIACKGLPAGQLKEHRRLAEQVYHTRMADLARQRVGLPVDRDRATFRYFAAWYLKHVTPTKRSAVRERSIIRRLVKYYGHWTLDRIDVGAAREYLTSRAKTVKPATANRELDVLKSMLTAAVPKYLPANPLTGMKRLRVRQAAPPVLSHDDEAKLLQVLSQADQALVIAALDTLVRLADLAKLKWAQDHGDHLEIHDPKAAPYRVAVSTRLRAALDALPRSSAYVFAHQARTATGPASTAKITQAFRFGCYAAGLRYGRPEGLTWHALRHTGATRALAAGASVRDLMALGGWRDFKSMARYTRPTGADRALVDRMSHARPVHVTGRKRQKQARIA
jgi:integrase